MPSSPAPQASPPPKAALRGAQVPPRFPLVRLGADQHRPAALRARIAAKQPEAARDLLIGIQHSPQVAPEAVLVELVGGGNVPEPAAIRADLVREHDAHLLVVPLPAELDLEVDQTDADPQEKADQEIVDAQDQRHDLVKLARR